MKVAEAMPHPRAFVRQSDNSEARVRAARHSDAPSLIDLWVASWQEAMPQIDFEARRGWITAFLGDPAYATLVVEDTNGSAGFLSTEGDHLHQLVVAPRAKGHGYATRLLDAAKAGAPGGLTLDVNQANARAVHFYAREGFTTIGRGTNPTSDLATWRMRWDP